MDGSNSEIERYWWEPGDEEGIEHDWPECGDDGANSIVGPAPEHIVGVL